MKRSVHLIIDREDLEELEDVQKNILCQIKKLCESVTENKYENIMLTIRAKTEKKYDYV